MYRLLAHDVLPIGQQVYLALEDGDYIAKVIHSAPAENYYKSAPHTYRLLKKWNGIFAAEIGKLDHPDWIDVAKDDTRSVSYVAVYVFRPKYTKAGVAISCIHPESGKTGTWLYVGPSHREAGSAVSPVMANGYELFKWCQANGWTNSHGGSYIKFETLEAPAAGRSA